MLTMLYTVHVTHVNKYQIDGKYYVDPDSISLHAGKMRKKEGTA